MLQELQRGKTMHLKMQRALRVGDIVLCHGGKVAACCVHHRLKILGGTVRTRLFGKLDNGSVDIANWWEAALTSTVLEWWYEDLHGRQPDIRPAVQALTRALLCATRRLRRGAGCEAATGLVDITEVPPCARFCHECVPSQCFCTGRVCSSMLFSDQ